MFALALALLGAGWNAGLIAGSTLLASAVPVAQRPRAEGAGELGMGFTAATATAIAGPVVGIAGYATLAVAGALRRRGARADPGRQRPAAGSRPRRRPPSGS